MDMIAVFVGGGLGAMARYALTFVPWKTVGTDAFPLATLVTNVVGSFVIGLIVGVVAARGLPARAELFAKTGVCGGFTTFSTFAFETTQLLGRGAYVTGAAYAALSFALGLAACVAGQALATRMLAR